MDWPFAVWVVVLLMPGAWLALACIVFTFWYQGNERTEILQPVAVVPKATIPILGANTRTIRKTRAAAPAAVPPNIAHEPAVRRTRLVELIHATQSRAESA